MRTVHAVRNAYGEWDFQGPEGALSQPLVLVFGNRHVLESEPVFDEVRARFPDGNLVFASGCGESINGKLYEGGATLMAIEFERASYRIRNANLNDHNGDLSQLCRTLAEGLPRTGLSHVLLISEGSSVNGSLLVSELESQFGPEVTMSGALAGDDARFERTLASYNEAPKEGEIVAVGLYGDSLRVSASNFGGWKGFGPQRTVTRSDGNRLYEIDGQPALDLYKRYLGDKAGDLPGSALLFPLQVQTHSDARPFVRTILNIDPAENAMVLAGDIPSGSRVQLMMATSDDILEGAARAAELALEGLEGDPEAAILVSCVGRKLVLDQRTEEELEEVASIIGEAVPTIGMYSYGELAPFPDSPQCLLHNQTMTLTLLRE